MLGLGHKTAEAPKKLSEKDQLGENIEALESGQEMVFRLGQIYVKPFITVLRNPEHPGKGKKFIAFQEGVGPDGHPDGGRGKFWETNHGKEIAGWVLEREGKRYPE